MPDALKRLKAWHKQHKLPAYDYTGDDTDRCLVWRPSRDRNIIVRLSKDLIVWDCMPAPGLWRGGSFVLDGKPCGGFLKQLTAITEATKP